MYADPILKYIAGSLLFHTSGVFLKLNLWCLSPADAMVGTMNFVAAVDDHS